MLIIWVGKQGVGIIKLNEFAHVHECSVIRNPGCLLHIVCDYYDCVLIFKFVNQLFNFGWIHIKRFALHINKNRLETRLQDRITRRNKRQGRHNNFIATLCPKIIENRAGQSIGAGLVKLAEAIRDRPENEWSELPAKDDAECLDRKGRILVRLFQNSKFGQEFFITFVSLMSCGNYSMPASQTAEKNGVVDTSQLGSHFQGASSRWQATSMV